MKLLIAYDGSQCADAALDDLTHAGLPSKSEALVLSVAEHWLPPPPPSAVEILQFAVEAKSPLSLERKYMAGSEALKQADALAKTAAARLQRQFPDWTIKHQAVWGSATHELFTGAEEFKADLLVVGSHGRSTLGRLFLGSTSQWLLNEAHCSVRIARGHKDAPDFPVRVTVAVDGSGSADMAVAEVARRHWPSKSEFRILVINQSLEPTALGDFVPSLRSSIDSFTDESNEKAKQLGASALQRLAKRRLRAEAIVKAGDPKYELLHFAEEWRADCIFMGATGVSDRFERFLLGSTAVAVAARAHCSVEIVRSKARRRKTNGNGNKQHPSN